MTTLGPDYRLDEAFGRLETAHRLKVPCAPVRDVLGDDIGGAYEVQRRLVEQWVAGGQRIVGAKIGLTSEAVQKSLGVFEPDYGTLLDSMAVPNGAICGTDMLIQPRIEAELAFVLGSDLKDARVGSAEVHNATAYVLPALEIVDSRVAEWDIGIVDTVADNASSALFVLGATSTELKGADTRTFGMRLNQGGEVVSVGAGAACLGSPVDAVAWLARTMARVGNPLRAGDVVLSGALGPMVDVHPGTTYEASFSGFGSVRVSFTSAEDE